VGRRQDSLLAHCIARAVIADAGGLDGAKEKWGEDAAGLKQAGKWQQMKVAVRATPRASRVAGFIVMWAWAMKDEKRDGYSITEYQRYWNENERKAYRLQADFRDLWPEFETPDDLARQVVPHLRSKKDAATMHMTVPVVAEWAG
jgi:hypothetical protein